MKTQLLSGLNLKQAIAVYWVILEMAQKLEGPVPSEGQEIPFGDFIITRGSNFELRQRIPFQQPWQETPVMWSGSATKAKNAADVAESLIGFLLQHELREIAEKELAEAKFEVRGGDVNVLGIEETTAFSLKEAEVVIRNFDNHFYSQNVIHTAWMVIAEDGYFHIPPYGKRIFVPTKRYEMPPEEFEEIWTRSARERVQIESLCGHIVQNVKEGSSFQYKEGTYTIESWPSPKIRFAGMTVLFGYVRSTFTLESVLHSGLLETWAKSLGYER